MSQVHSARVPAPRTFTASEVVCPEDGSKLWIAQHRKRVIHGLDESIAATFRDTRCTVEGCPLGGRRYRPAEEAMLVLPRMHFGLDVVTAVGSMRMREDASFPKIHTRLVERGVPIAPMTVQYIFRDYLALASCVAGRTDEKLLRKLRRQGGVIPVIDGVQFGEGDPVLYLIVDALSHRPLFGKEFTARAAEDLVPFIRQLNDIGVPILAAVSDKEKALVPAIAEALPGVRHQLCQLHYVGNVAKPMDEDLKALGAEIRRTEEDLRRYERKLLRDKRKAERKGVAPAADIGVSLELAEAARAEARRARRSTRRRSNDTKALNASPMRPPRPGGKRGAAEEP